MSSLPKTYKAAVFEKHGAPLIFKDFELQEPTEGKVLIKVLACGVCHTDSDVQIGQAGYGNGFPIVPGHEIIGDIAAVGPGVTKWKVGDRVGGAFHGGHDNVCKQCQRGQFQMCKLGLMTGITIDGGYAEYVIIRTEAVVKVPAELDPAECAPILCAGVTVFSAIRRLKIASGELVAVQGLGGLGHLAVQYVAKMGYRVAVLSSGGEKRDFALKLGAHEYIDTSKEDPAQKLQQLGGAALIVSTAPNAKAAGPLVGGLAPCGHLLILSVCGSIEVDSRFLIGLRASVSGSAVGHALDCEEAIAFTQLHGIKCMVERFPFKDVHKAYDHMVTGDARFRSVLVME